ncbi:MAG: DUF928 domain-containing protein [Pseudomonadales bacterium]
MTQPRLIVHKLSICLLLSSQLLNQAVAEESAKELDSTTLAEQSQAAADKAQAPVYIPANRGATRHRSGAATRGSGSKLPQLELIAPAHTGLTTQAEPILYWYLSQPSPVPVQLTIVAPNLAEPLLSLRLPPPVSAGLHTLALAKHEVSLGADVNYTWYAALVPDESQRSQDLVAAAGLRVAAASAPQVRTIHGLAAAGLWYDTFAELQRQLGGAGPAQQTQLLAARVALLEQIGLTDLDL